MEETFPSLAQFFSRNDNTFVLSLDILGPFQCSLVNVTR